MWVGSLQKNPRKAGSNGNNNNNTNIYNMWSRHMFFRLNSILILQGDKIFNRYSKASKRINQVGENK